MFAKRLKELRNKRGLTQQQISDRLGLARTTYSGYENGAREPDIDSLKKFSEFFGVTIDYMTGKDVDGELANVKDEFLKIYYKLPEDKRMLIREVAKSMQENQGK